MSDGVGRALGRPELVSLLRDHIVQHGPLTFAQFMEAALYEPGLGYYTAPSEPSVAHPRPLADFQTSSQVHPAFGWLIARELAAIWEMLGRPAPFVVAELGAGAGELAHQIRDGLAAWAPDGELEYHAVDLGAAQPMRRGSIASVSCPLSPWENAPLLVEGEGGCLGRVRVRAESGTEPGPPPHPAPSRQEKGSGRARAALATVLSPLPGERVRVRAKPAIWEEPATGHHSPSSPPVPPISQSLLPEAEHPPARGGGRRAAGLTWWPKLAALADAGVAVHCVVSNEFFDALPVHRVAWLGGALREVFVDWAGVGFVERLGEPSDPALATWLAESSIVPTEGWRGEICLQLEPILATIALLVRRGVVLTIDYGYEAAEPGRLADSLLAYHRHHWSEDVYRRVGEQDLTSHVDFAAFLRIGRAHGLEPAGTTTQWNFLLGLDLADEAERWARREGSPARQWQARFAMAELVRPEGLGRLKVVGQQKGVPAYWLRTSGPIDRLGMARDESGRPRRETAGRLTPRPSERALPEGPRFQLGSR